MPKLIVVVITIAKIKVNGKRKQRNKTVDTYRYLSVVTEQVARDYIDKFNLTIHYSRELKDGTPRRLWDIHDPSGNKAGSLYTAQGAYGFKNREPWKDIFDFAEFRVSRDDWDDVDFKEPQTAHFDFKVKK